jgi:eukaryotic-like serine/threonine-protein kinase
LQRFALSHPWLAPRALELQKIRYDMIAAVQKGDGQTALSRLAGVPDVEDANQCFFRARAYLLTNDYAAAESEFRSVLGIERSLENGRAMADRFPALGILTHYYLGELYERTGKRDQAVNEYQEFLSHFENSQTRLPQLADAHNALKRLMQ